MSYSIVFAGTPEASATVLSALLASAHRVIGVLTQPDKSRGRGKKQTQSPVKQAAINAGVPVFQPETLQDQAIQQALHALKPDIIIVVAYGMLLPQAVLALPQYGCINVHYSLLPRWRGAAPIERAIEAGDTTTGVSIMQMDAGLDTGDVLAMASLPISPDTSSAALYEQLSVLAPKTLLATLNQLDASQQQAKKQVATQATYAKKLTKQEAEINWDEPAAMIVRKIQAFNPRPVARAYLDETMIRFFSAHEAHPAPSKAAGEILRADKTGLSIMCGDGAITITQLQLPGKDIKPFSELINGYATFFCVGKRFR